jgi:hypothetical protein
VLQSTVVSVSYDSATRGTGDAPAPEAEAALVQERVLPEPSRVNLTNFGAVAWNSP